MADSDASLIYLGKNGTIKIDKKGRPRLYQWSSLDDDNSSVSSSNSNSSSGIISNGFNNISTVNVFSDDVKGVSHVGKNSTYNVGLYVGPNKGLNVGPNNGLNGPSNGLNVGRSDAHANVGHVNVGPTTIRIEEDTSIYDSLYHVAAQRRNNYESTPQYTLKPSTNGRSPAASIQKGTSIPLEVAGGPRSKVQWRIQEEGGAERGNSDVFAMPVEYTSQINIQMLMQQQQQQQQQQLLQQQKLLQQQQQSQTTSHDITVPPPPPLPPANGSHLASVTNSNQTKVVNDDHDGNNTNGKYTNGKATSESGDMMAELRSKMESRNLSNEALQIDELEEDMSYNTISDSESEDGLTRRVAVAASTETVVIVQFACENKTTSDLATFYDKLAETAEACLRYFKKLSSDKMDLSSSALGQIKLDEQRTVDDVVNELQNDLHDVITASATGRKANEKRFVGTFINDPITQGRRGQVSVGQTAVIVVLQRLNRLAPLREFSDQLCHHVALLKPKDLGKPGTARPRTRRKPHGLQEQGFLYDNTITVWEASRRAFTEIVDFAFLG